MYNQSVSTGSINVSNGNPTHGSEIQGVTNLIDERITALGDRLSLLSERVSSVLRPSEPAMASTGTPVAPQNVSPHTQQLEVFADRLENTLWQVNDMLTRLAL